MLALLPGLLVALVAAATWWILWRWFEPVPRGVALAHSAVVLVLFWKVLFFGAVLLPLENVRASPPFDQLPKPEPTSFVYQGDVIEDFVPYAAEARRHLRNGEWPLLNTVVGAGEPLLANTQSQVFHPLSLLTLPLPLSLSAAAVSGSKVFLSLTFSFLLLRRLSASAPAALAGSMVYGLGGFLMMWLGWPHAHSTTALPMILLGVEVLFERTDRAAHLLLAVGVLWALLGGHPQTIVVVAAIAGLWVAYRLARDRSLLGRPTIRLAATVLVAALLTAPVWLTAALYAPQSARAQVVEALRANDPPATAALARWSDSAERRRALESAVRSAAPILNPFVHGVQQRKQYWGPSNQIEDASVFAGTLAPVALLVLLVARRRSPQEWAFLGLTLGALVLVLDPPGVSALLRELPLVGLLASNLGRAALPFVLGCSALTAFALARLERGGLRPWSGGAAVAVVLALAATAVFLSHPGEPVRETVAGLRNGFLLLQIGTGVGALLLARSLRRRPRLAWGFSALIALELLVAHARLHVPMPADLYFPPVKAVTFLQEGLDDAVPHDLGSERMVALDNVLLPNFPTVYGIADLRSANPLQPGLVRQLLAPVRPNRISNRAVVADHPIYDLLGVRFVVAKPGRAPGLERSFGGHVHIHRRPGPLPLLFLPEAAVVAEGRDALERTVRAVDHLASTVVDSPPGSAAGAESGWRAAADRAPEMGPIETSATTVATRVALAESRLLASRIYQDGGWRLLVDGRRWPTVTTNAAFVGAWIPAGDHQLTLVYRPPGFLPGLAISAVTLVLALAWLARSGPRPAESGLRPPTAEPKTP